MPYTACTLSQAPNSDRLKFSQTLNVALFGDVFKIVLENSDLFLQY